MSTQHSGRQSQMVNWMAADGASAEPFAIKKIELPESCSDVKRLEKRNG